MNKNKFAKALLALGLGVVTAVSAVGLTACDPDSGDGGDGKTPLDAPEITLDNTTKKITWDSVGNATGYKVYEKLSTAETATEIVTITACGYTITQSVAGEYDYYVVATSTSEEYKDSKASNTVTCEVEGYNPTNNAIIPNYTGPAAALTPGTDEVTYSVKMDDVSATETAIPEDWTNGTFTVISGSSIRTRSRSLNGKSYARSLKLGDDTHYLQLNAPTEGKLTLILENGSSSVESASILFNGTSTSYNKSGVVALEIDIPSAGTYTVKRNSATNSTTDIYYAEFTATLSNTPIESIEVVNKGKSDYLLTQKLDCTGITISALHKDTGKRSEVNLSSVQFDTSDYDASTSGTYNVKVTYIIKGNLSSDTTTFTATYPVKVYTVTDITLDTTLTSNEKQTTLKQAYLPGESLDTTGLTVTATGTLGSDSVKFKMNATDYTVTPPDLTTEGKKQVTVSVASAYAGGATVEKTYDVVVKAKKDDSSGAISLTVGTDGEFDTVTQALNYLKACGYSDKNGTNVVKTINIADGEYYEKISIDIPNVHLIGSATNTPNHETNNGVVLWYDAANGLVDPAGASYGTKGSASVTVMSTADNFVAENITFKNYYNNADLYYALKAETSGTQAVALMVESNSAIFKNCKFTGYQDTLYANKGYQFYQNCWIEGRTDYIFGADAIPYFYQCTIYTVSAGTKDGDGGYIVAYQNTSISYGPVFNGCTITGSATGATNIALGRSWGAECAMVIMNSKISGNYSKAPHTTGTQKAERYVTMSGVEPKAANMREYNNTGLDGVTPDLTEAQKTALAGTCTFLTADQAAKYQIENVATLLKFNPLA